MLMLTIWRPPTGGCDSPRPPPVHDHQPRGQHHHELLYVKRQEKSQGGGQIQEGGNPGLVIECIRWGEKEIKRKHFSISQFESGNNSILIIVLSILWLFTRLVLVKSPRVHF